MGLFLSYLIIFSHLLPKMGYKKVGYTFGAIAPHGGDICPHIPTKGYLRNHSSIHKEMTFLVRQLSPESDGLPIEIYVFSNDTNWANYEAIQSDIFDHLLAVLSEFDLRVFQDPAGNDFKKIN